MPAEPQTQTQNQAKPKRRVRRRKIVTTVNLEPAVRAYLDLLMQRHDRDRSYIVNALVKRHMRQEIRPDDGGTALSPPPPDA